MASTRRPESGWAAASGADRSLWGAGPWLAGPWLAATMSWSASPRSRATATVSWVSTAPSGPSRRQLTWRDRPVRAAAASWLCTAARDGRSTKAVNIFPVE